MHLLYLLLVAAAVICFLLASAGTTFRRPVNLVALGLFFWALVSLIRLVANL